MAESAVVTVEVDVGGAGAVAETAEPTDVDTAPILEAVASYGDDGIVEEPAASQLPIIHLREIHKYKPGAKVYPYLPQVPVLVTVTSIAGRANVDADSSNRKPRFRITLEHGQFKWTVQRYYREVLALRRDLLPLRDKIRRRRSRREALPHLLKMEDINVRQATRLRKQVPKVQTFLNAVMSIRMYRGHPATERFFEVSRISFINDTGPKMKEGLLTKRSGGHRRAANCFGFTACFICRCSFWRKRWFVLKDNYLVMIRSHHSSEARRTISGVMLFDTGMIVNYGLTHTGIRHGIKITNQSRDLLVKAPSKRVMNEWVSAIEEVMETTAKIWVEPKPHYSFAPQHHDIPSRWYVDGDKYMSDVADAILAAKDEIFITDWQFSPHIFLKRKGSHKNRLQWRLDYLLLKKAEEGVRIFLQIYREPPLAINLGSEYAMDHLKHPNIVFFRHPNVFIAGVLLWAHHEKIIIIDQTLAFVGGIDLAFGRWDNESHVIHDHYPAPLEEHIPETAPTNIDESEGEGSGEGIQQWIGKDFFNPFIKDGSEHHLPFVDDYDRSKDPRMPWHDIASAVYGATARDVARHFIQRYNFTKREQEEGEEIPHLLPRKTFLESELIETQYLKEVLEISGPAINTSTQVLRSVDEWSGGIPLEQSIMNAWIQAIDKAKHFIYIEQQFFVSSLKDDVKNGIAEALRLRIARAYRDKETFRVIIVMPLLPSFPAENFGTKETAILEAVTHWNYHSLSRGKDSLYGRLHHEDGIPEDEIKNYISAYGLRNYGEIDGKPASEIVYVHSKLMVVDDRITIIGSANINDRSMIGERDSEVAIRYEDKEMMEGSMNGNSYEVGKYSHSIRTHIFKEHLGLLPNQRGGGSTDISVEDPASDDFYLNTWMNTAKNNTKVYEQVFGGSMVPNDTATTYDKLKEYKENKGVAGEDMERARELLSQTQGHLVWLPLHFLEQEDLTPDLNYIVNYAPGSLFT